MRKIVFLEPNNSILKSVILALNLGLDIFGVLIFSVFIGLIADRYFNIAPIGILISSIFGIIGSFKKILEIGGKKK